MIPLLPVATRTEPPCPYTTLFRSVLRAVTALLAWNHRCRHDTISPAGTKRDPAPALPAAMNDEPVRACPHRGKHAGDRSTRRASVESRGNDDQKRLISVSPRRARGSPRSEEHTSELQSLMRTSYAVFCLKKKKQT